MSIGAKKESMKKLQGQQLMNLGSVVPISFEVAPDDAFDFLPVNIWS